MYLTCGIIWLNMLAKVQGLWQNKTLNCAYSTRHSAVSVLHRPAQMNEWFFLVWEHGAWTKSNLPHVQCLSSFFNGRPNSFCWIISGTISTRVCNFALLGIKNQQKHTIMFFICSWQVFPFLIDRMVRKSPTSFRDLDFCYLSFSNKNEFHYCCLFFFKLKS